MGAIMIDNNSFNISDFSDDFYSIKDEPIPITDKKTFYPFFYGDLLLDFFDQENNMINPPSDAGFYLYNLFGRAFDDAQEIINNMLLNLDPVTCKLPYLNIIAMELKLKRNPEWNDDKWRAAVISYYYNLETVAGIEFVLNLINDYYNKPRGEVEHEKIVVDGYYTGFNLSDKFNSFSRCSDKNSELEDKIGNLYEETFNIDFKDNPQNKIIEELLAIIWNGGIN